MAPWISLPSHNRWLDEHAAQLLEFARPSAVPGGFAWLDDDGHPVDKPVELWITCRMTHSFALGHLMGRPGFGPLIDHGVDALLNAFQDKEFGGWFAAIDVDGETITPVNTAKEAYGHAFVILAASSAVAAGRPGAKELLEAALAVNEQWFWDEEAGLSREGWDRSFTDGEAYRGVNANMHTVEAYLAAADVTGSRIWLERAYRITERVVHDWARHNSWRIPEHFDSDWNVDLDYNAKVPAHPFRPYGATIGHALEWARLAMTVRLALGVDHVGMQNAPAWMLEDSKALFDAAVKDGWAADGADGFVYTTDWDGLPVVSNRMHWVVCEGIATAAALFEATGKNKYAKRYAEWWDYADSYLLDHERGSWRHELDRVNAPASSTWSGKPDIYHALQATLVPRLPLHPTFATALEQGLLP